jgi:5-hydroxyisourate hydrolase-like protein (transthyretin family)
MAVISSHTLNGADGTHAGGIRVRLTSLASGETLFDTEMDAGGRLSRNVDLTGTDPASRYELTFETGPYWRARGAPSAGARTIDEIVLRFCMPDPDARYHMPLIISPHSYSTWASTPE